MPCGCVRRAGPLAWVLVIILLVLLALMVCQYMGTAAVVQVGAVALRADGASRLGGAEDEAAAHDPVPIEAPHHEHAIMRSVLHNLSDQVSDFEPPTSRATGGAAGRSAKVSHTDPPRHWTDYGSWSELTDTPAYRQYWQERMAVLKQYPTDWSRVRDELSDILQEPREWAGSINLTGPEQIPTVAHKIPSPMMVGENTPHPTGAIIPADVVSRASDTPAMFFFHTHPATTSPLISSIDAAAAVLGCYLGRHAAHLVVSPTAVIMYGLLPTTLAQIWKDSNPKLAAERKALDVYSAVEGLRSYGMFYSAQDLADIMRNMGLLYVVYPLDRFVQSTHNNVFIPSQIVNVAEMRHRLERVEAAQVSPDIRAIALGDADAHSEDLPVVADSGHIAAAPPDDE